MTVTSYSVAVTVGTATFNFADGATGKHGASALYSLTHKETIDAIGSHSGESSRVIIPFASVDFAAVTTTTATVDDPVDANCSESNSGD